MEAIPRLGPAMLAMPIRAVLLAAFLLACGAPLLTFWLWPHSAAMEKELEAVEERHLLIAQNVSQVLTKYDFDVRTLFGSLASRLADGQDLAFTRPLLRALNFDHLCVVDIKTRQSLRVLLGDAHEVGAVIPAPLLERLLELAETRPGQLSDIIPPQGNLGPHMLIAQRHGDTIVFGRLNTGFFSALAARVSFGTKGHAAIVDATGATIYHPRPEWRETAKNLSALEPVERVLAGESGVATFVSPALGDEVITGFARVTGPGWGVMIPQPVSELRASADHIGRSVLTIFLTGLILSASIAVWVSSGIAKAVGNVANAARQMAKGAIGVRAQCAARFGIREMRNLADSFNAMAQEKERSLAKITYLAERDPLTQLLNRAAFFQKCSTRLAVKPADLPATLYFVDVDGLKACNDAFGHAVGDALLRRVAQELVQLSGPSDLVGRQSGDEFVLFCVGRSPDEIRALDRSLRAALGQTLDCDESRHRMSCSIGRADCGTETRDLRTLLRYADQAMYTSKKLGGNRVTAFDAAMLRDIRHADMLRIEVLGAIAKDKIELQYQPILSVADRQVVGLEALARWPSGDAGTTSDLIASAEDAGVICDLGRQLRGKAMEPDGHWRCTLRESASRDSDEFIGDGKGADLSSAILAAILRVIEFQAQR